MPRSSATLRSLSWRSVTPPVIGRGGPSSAGRGERAGQAPRGLAELVGGQRGEGEADSVAARAVDEEGLAGHEGDPGVDGHWQQLAGRTGAVDEADPEEHPAVRPVEG